jgi:hypothetical protein
MLVCNKSRTHRRGKPQEQNAEKLRQEKWKSRKFADQLNWMKKNTPRKEIKMYET